MNTSATRANNAAVLKKLRESKTRTAKVVEETRKADPFQRWAAATDELLDEIDTPSWARQALAITLGIAVYAGAWVGGLSVINAVTALMIASVGAGLLTTFVAIFCSLVAFVLAMYASFKAYSFTLSFNYGAIERRVAGWFSRKEHAHA